MYNREDFIGQKHLVIKHFKKKGVSSDTVSEYCTLTGLPLVIVYEFIMEEMPEHSKLCKKKIKEINDFYGVSND